MNIETGQGNQPFNIDDNKNQVSYYQFLGA